MVTVEDLLEGKSHNLPGQFFTEDTFKKATKKVSNDGHEQLDMGIE